MASSCTSTFWPGLIWAASDSSNGSTSWSFVTGQHDELGAAGAGRAAPAAGRPGRAGDRGVAARGERARPGARRDVLALVAVHRRRRCRHPAPSAPCRRPVFWARRPGPARRPPAPAAGRACAAGRRAAVEAVLRGGHALLRVGLGDLPAASSTRLRCSAATIAVSSAAIRCLAAVTAAWAVSTCCRRCVAARSRAAELAVSRARVCAAPAGRPPGSAAAPAAPARRLPRRSSRWPPRPAAALDRLRALAASSLASLSLLFCFLADRSP